MLAAILDYSSVRDWTRFCHVIGFENIRIHLPHVIGFVAGLFFSTLGEQIQKYPIGIHCRVHQMRVKGSRIGKEKVVDSKNIRKHVHET